MGSRTKALCPRGGLRWALLLLAAAAAAPAATAEVPAEAHALLKQINNLEIDPSEIYALRDARLTIDRMNLYFDRGFVAFFARAGGQPTGAVFTGSGEVLLIPPDKVEKRNLAQFAGAPILEERFVSAYLRFTDQTARDLMEHARKPDPDDPEQPDGFADQWNTALQNLGPESSLRILTDLLGDRRHPYFYARLQGTTLGVFEVIDDERAPEAVKVGALQEKGSHLYADVWCSFPSHASQGHLESLSEGAVRVLSYKIDTRINPDHTLESRAELELQSLWDIDRALGFELSRWLAVSEVKDEEGRSLEVFQNPSGEGLGELPRSRDEILVVLRSPYPVGQKFRLTFTYHGNVITDVGNGVLYVGSRGSWYPNRSTGRPISYVLTFHYPDKLTLVATGRRVEQKTSDGWVLSRWLSDGVSRMAGFNLGSYSVVDGNIGKTKVQVFAAREAEAALERRRTSTPIPPIVLGEPHGGAGNVTLRIVPRLGPPLDPAAKLNSVASVATDAIQYYEKLFGPFPYPRLAISQIPGGFGQGWPELVYLPTLSFLPKEQRSELGLKEEAGNGFGPTIIAHEIAHQWWGNLVGWDTYHDQWLSEAIASYAAALFIAQGKDGDRTLSRLLQAYKHDLLSKTHSGDTVESGGPIWLGHRLSTSSNPDGYNAIVYKKACWVLHMLRGLMTDPNTGSDAKFFTMLRDFATAYGGKNASTEDFIRHAAKYMAPGTDLDHNHRLDWFFDEWVYGTGIPTYSIDSNVRRIATNRYVIQGSIEQSDVPKNFEMLVPVIACVGQEKRVPLGRVVVSANKARFKFTTSSKPSRISIDEDNILAVVR